MAPEAESRKIVCPFLDLFDAALRKEPGEFQAWIEDNRLQRALAHLVGRGSNASAFIRCSDQGILLADSMVGVVAPSGRDIIDQEIAPYKSMLVAQPRMVLVNGPWSGTDTFAYVYDSDTVGGHNRLVGTVTLNAPLARYFSGKYVEVASNTADNGFTVLWWNL